MLLPDDIGGFKPSDLPISPPNNTPQEEVERAKTLQGLHNSLGCGLASGFSTDTCLAIRDQLMRSMMAAVRQSGRKPWGPVAFIVAGASDGAKGVKRSASILGSGLNRGSSVAGKYLYRAGKTAQQLAPLAKAGGPIAVFGVLVSSDIGKAAAQVAGGIAGAHVGGLACGAIAVASVGVGAVSCIVLVPAGGVAGSVFAGWLYTKGSQVNRWLTRKGSG